MAAGNGKVKELYSNLMKGNRRALSRFISCVENENEKVIPVMKEVYKNLGKAYRIGITGPPGAGKSTLVNSLAGMLRKQGKSVGILAVDPTSPFTGGALLGDRIRMSMALSDLEIFMRSMASRGGVGGLARTTPQAADVMDAFGFDVVIIETVGVGQLELDVADTVDTTVVVLVPDTGGNVQAMKAGLIEIADIFVINKADHVGAGQLEQDLLDAMDLKPKSEQDEIWEIPILKTTAIDGGGVKELIDTLYRRHDVMEETNQLHVNRIEQKRRKIISILKYRIENRLWKNPELEGFLTSLSRLCVEGRMDPFTAADAFIKRSKVMGGDRDEAFLHR